MGKIESVILGAGKSGISFTEARTAAGHKGRYGHYYRLVERLVAAGRVIAEGDLYRAQLIHVDV